MKKIDAHSHLGDFEGWTGVEFGEQELLRQMEEHDIERTFLAGPSSQGNDIVLDAFQRHPDKIVPFVWIDPVRDDVERKLGRYIVDEGFRGVKMHPLFDAFVADDPVADPVMAFAEAHRVPVFIHCGHPPFSLPWSIALLAERWPKVKVVMIHMGHGHGVYIDASIKMARRYDNLWLEMSGMPMGCKIAEAYRTVGADRILFGIDLPFHHPTVEIQKVLTCGLSDAEQQDVFYRNAKKLLDL
ncbi:MAG: amidohydrolase [Synergistaceae bacterium]|nr:amidohydrolase [Synergistaceae bacterium]